MDIIEMQIRCRSSITLLNALEETLSLTADQKKALSLFKQALKYLDSGDSVGAATFIREAEKLMTS
jgi:hypothetical protein